MKKQKILWHTSEESTLESGEVPVLSSPEDVLVQAHMSLVSLGTERLVVRGEVPQNAYLKMRVPYMQGEFNQTFTYGYSMVGQVVDGPEELCGRRVHLMHPHQQYALVNKADLFLLPDSLSPVVATLISNMETAINAVWDSGVTIGDRVVIIGYGIIGLLVAHLVAQIPGVELTILEINPERRSLAERQHYNYQVRICADASEFDMKATIAFNTGTSSESLQTAIESVGFEGLVVEMGWYGRNETRLELGGSFHYDRKRLIASQVSQIPLIRREEWDYKRRKQLALSLLMSLEATSFIDRQIPFNSAGEFFNSLRKAAPNEPGVVLTYPDTA